MATERRRILTGWALAAFGVAIVVVNLIAFNWLYGPVMLALEFTGFVLLVLLAIVVRHLLRRCNRRAHEAPRS